MNRRDFDLLARGLKLSRPRPGAPDETMIWAQTATTVADTLAAAKDCGGFDRARFLKACGVT